MRIQGGITAFTGWEPDEKLAGKLNNQEELNELANVSNVDRVSTSMLDNNKYLPRHNLYTTISSKKVHGKIVHATDCVFLSKDASVEEVSDKVFESVQSAIGKLYGRIAKQNIENNANSQADVCQNVVNKKTTNIFKKLVQMFKKA